jgi:hypothetical protein
LEIPGFIKDSTVTRFYNAGVEVKVGNVLISHGIAQVNSCEVVVVEFAPARASAFHAYTRTKGLKMCVVRFASIPTFIGSFVHGKMNKLVVQIHGI